MRSRSLIIALVFLVLAGGGGYFGYMQWQQKQERQQRFTESVAKAQQHIAAGEMAEAKVFLDMAANLDPQNPSLIDAKMAYDKGSQKKNTEAKKKFEEALTSQQWQGAGEALAALKDSVTGAESEKLRKQLDDAKATAETVEGLKKLSSLTGEKGVNATIPALSDIATALKARGGSPVTLTPDAGAALEDLYKLVGQDAPEAPATAEALSTTLTQLQEALKGRREKLIVRFETFYTGIKEVAGKNPVPTPAAFQALQNEADELSPAMALWNWDVEKQKGLSSAMTDLGQRVDAEEKRRNPPLSAEAKLELSTLQSLAKQASETEGAERAQLLQDFLNRSASFAAKNPTPLNVWAMRALAALELGKSREGWEAGKKLKAMGALDSQDDSIKALCVRLNLKGWMTESYEDVQKAEQKALAEETEKMAKRWIGTWEVSASTSYSYERPSASYQEDYSANMQLTINALTPEGVVLTATDVRQDNVTGEGWTRRDNDTNNGTVPGAFTYRSRGSDSMGNFTHDNGTYGTYKITSVEVLDKARIMAIHYDTTNSEGKTTSSTFAFALSEDGLRVYGSCVFVCTLDAGVDPKRAWDQHNFALITKQYDFVQEAGSAGYFKFYYLQKTK